MKVGLAMLCLALFIIAINLVGCRTYSEDNHALIPTPLDLQDIDDLRAAVVSAVLKGDADAYAALCTEDVRLLHPNTPIVTGREALRKQEALVFEAVRITKLELSPIEIYGNGDLVYEVGTQEVAIEPSDERFLGSRKYVHVLKKERDGQWRFAVLMSNNNQ